MNEIPNMIGNSGWVCPKCGRVYSPYTSMCKYCGGEGNTRIINGTSTAPVPKPFDTAKNESTEHPIDMMSDRGYGL